MVGRSSALRQIVLFYANIYGLSGKLTFISRLTNWQARALASKSGFISIIKFCAFRFLPAYSLRVGKVVMPFAATVIKP